MTLTVDALPSHKHGVACDNSAGDEYAPTGKVPAGAQDRGNNYGEPVTGQLMDSGMITATGGGEGHTNIQPYLGINFAISWNGSTIN